MNQKATPKYEWWNIKLNDSRLWPNGEKESNACRLQRRTKQTIKAHSNLYMKCSGMDKKEKLLSKAEFIIF